MSNGMLFAFGCGVTFLFLAGVYVLMREDFQRRHDLAEKE